MLIPSYPPSKGGIRGGDSPGAGNRNAQSAGNFSSRMEKIGSSETRRGNTYDLLKKNFASAYPPSKGGIRGEGTPKGQPRRSPPPTADISLNKNFLYLMVKRIMIDYLDL